jgi:hypothetical protein
MRRARALVLALLLVALTGGGAALAVDTWSFGAADVGSRAELPAGWRWESYGGLEVGVPGDWGWVDSSLRLDSWCVGAGGPQKPAVGRASGIVLTIICPGDGMGGPVPEKMIRNTGWVVAFGDAPGHADGVDHELDRSTVWLDGVEVAIQAPALLRKLIAATIHRVRMDSSGCPVTHPIMGQPRLRPTPATAVTTLRAVTTISACRYRLNTPDNGSAPPLLFSSLRLDGAAARAAVERIARLPLGGGPNHPDQCLPEYADGRYAIVLRVRSAAGPTEIVLRYAGCDHNAFDDGVTVRTLTPAAVAPFATGSNQMISGER